MTNEHNDSEASFAQGKEATQIHIGEPSVAMAQRDIAQQPEQESPQGMLSRLLSSTVIPTVLATVLILIALGFAATQVYPQHGAGFMSRSAPQIVTFDPVKFINAQRAAASILATRPNADMAFSITQVASQADQVIREEANGALIVVKQALVLPNDVHDITDAVLTRFGLPTNTPTVSTSVISEDALESYAPTNSAYSPERYEEDERITYTERSFELEEQIQTLDEHSNLLP